MTHSVQAEALIRLGIGNVEPQPGRPILDLDLDAPDTWKPNTLKFLADHVRWGSTPVALVSAIPEHDPRMADLLTDIGLYVLDANGAELTVTRKAADWAFNFCRTLARSPSPPWATTLDQPLAGQTVFVISAGTSLDHVGHLLPSLSAKGFVIATNSSAKAALHYGLTPDLVMCVEAKDLHTHLADVDAPSVLAAQAHPANWSACMRQPMAIPTHDSAFIPYLTALGVPFLPYGVSVFNAAISLAHYWGAARIVLVGYTMGYVDGRVYAKGSPFDDLTYTIDGNTLRQSGASKQPAAVDIMHRPGWNGGPAVVSSHHFDSEYNWVARAANVIPLMTNCSPNGVHVPSTTEIPLQDLLALLPDEPRTALPTPPAVDPSPVIADLRRKAEHYLANPAPVVPYDFPLMQAFAAPIILQRYRYTSAEADMRLIDAMTNACKTMLEIFDG